MSREVETQEPGDLVERVQPPLTRDRGDSYIRERPTFVQWAGFWFVWAPPGSDRCALYGLLGYLGFSTPPLARLVADHRRLASSLPAQLRRCATPHLFRAGRPHRRSGQAAGMGACHSERALDSLFQDEESSGSVLAAVAAQGQYPIPTRAIHVFSRSFYAALGRGADVASSFKVGEDAVRTDDFIGERALPEGADQGMPSPWKRLLMTGRADLCWTPKGEAAEPAFPVAPSLHRQLRRTEQLFVGRNENIAATVERLEPALAGIRERRPRVVTMHGEGDAAVELEQRFGIRFEATADPA